MKKLLFLFLIIPLFQSCTEENYLSENKLTDSENTPTLKFGGDGKYDLLGFGYDVTGEYLNNDESTRFQVVDAEAFVLDAKNKGRYHEEGSYETKAEIYSGATAEDFLQEIKTKNSIGTSATLDIKAINIGANLKGSADINNKYTYSTKYSFARIDLVKRAKRMVLNAIVEDLKPYLNPAFVQDLNRKTPDQIVKDYGTHVLCDISIGGRMQFDYRSAIYEETSRTEKKFDVEAGASFNVGLIKIGGNNSHSLEINKERNSKNSTWNMSIKSRGSKHSGIGDVVFSNEALPNRTFNLKEWEEGVTEKNAALIKIGWDRAFPIYDFITDPVKKAQIKAAVEKYINGKVIVIDELKPLYRYHYPYSNFHHYTTNWEELGREKLGYKFERVEGYLLKNSWQGTNPLYRYYKPSRGNHFYTSDWAEIGTGKFGYNYEWVEGYLFKDNINGAKPLYRYHHPSQDHHFYTTDWSELGSSRLGYNYEKIVGYIYPAN